MKLIRTLIVDDEPLARRGIRQLLAEHADVEVVGEATNGDHAVELALALAPDLLFLDVEMPGVDGFAVLSRLGPRTPPALVFVTAHETFAVRAFDAEALDYLMKPLHEGRFVRALDRAREALRRTGGPARRIFLGSGRGGILVDPSEIERIEAEDDYVTVHARGAQHLVRDSLAAIHERLGDARFVRAHRTALVGLAHVRAFDGSRVVLASGASVAVGRRRRAEVAAVIRRFAGAPFAAGE